MSPFTKYNENCSLDQLDGKTLNNGENRRTNLMSTSEYYISIVNEEFGFK